MVLIKRIGKIAAYGVGGILVLLFVVAEVVSLIPEKTPELTIASPANNFETHDATATISGSVSPVDAVVTVNGLHILVKDGKFSYAAKLNPDSNSFNVVADNKGKTSNQTIVVNRTFTPEEKTQYELEKQQAQEKAAAEVAAQKAKEQATLDAYYATKAGRICKAHSDWTKDECQSLADNKIWIGMKYEMLVYIRGKPDSANPSNYGSGTQYQYCWYDYTPKCFYDQDGDGLLDAYN